MKSFASLLRAVDEKKITCEDAVQRLESAIRQEYRKKEAPDFKLIHVCEDLLYQIKTGKKEWPDFHTQKYLQAVRNNAKRSEKARKSKNFFLRSAAAAAVVLILLTGGVIFCHRRLTVTPSENQQQWIVSGHENKPIFSEEGNADSFDVRDTTVYSLEDLIAFLGFDPSVPETLGNCRFECAFAAVFPNQIHTNIRYKNGDSTLNYNITFFSDYENAYMTYEKEDNMGIYDVCNTKVYASGNYDRFLTIWHEENIVHALTSNISLEENLKLTEEIIQMRSR